MMRQKKAERQRARRRKRHNDILISDNDDLVKEFIESMKAAANVRASSRISK